VWAYTDNENTQPLPFRARFVPRSEKIERIIKDEAESARDGLRARDGMSNVSLDQFM
jgi:hypothetical protein